MVVRRPFEPAALIGNWAAGEFGASKTDRTDGGRKREWRALVGGRNSRVTPKLGAPRTGRNACPTHTGITDHKGKCHWSSPFRYHHFFRRRLYGRWRENRRVRRTAWPGSWSRRLLDGPAWRQVRRPGLNRRNQCMRCASAPEVRVHPHGHRVNNRGVLCIAAAGHETTGFAISFKDERHAARQPPPPILRRPGPLPLVRRTKCSGRIGERLKTQ